jgi:DNA (cytosine-5)-methyltransferase 1
MVGPEVQARIEEVLRRFDPDVAPPKTDDELPLPSATILKFPQRGGGPVRPHGSGRRPLLLDLFCCAGGAGVGYYRAGFDVVGVDIVPRPSYPLAFIQADAMALDPKFVALFDAVHASPPCQSYSDLAKRNRNGDEWPRLVEPVREMLRATGKPYVIENVEGAPLEDPVVLCGTMFPGLRVLRHRLFEANFPIQTPPHGKHPKVHTFDKRKSHFGKTDEWKDFVQVTGGGNCSLAAARDAMGIDWMTKGEINEAIPPAYTELIGKQLLAHMQADQLRADAVSDRS